MAASRSLSAFLPASRRRRRERVFLPSYFWYTFTYVSIEPSWSDALPSL